MFSPLHKSYWDTRSWLLGLFLGNLAGLLLFCGGYPPPRRFLEAAFPYSAFGYYTGDLLIASSLICGFLIFPAVLTYTARRCYAFWGLLPIFLWMLWVVADSIIGHSFASLFDPVWPLPTVAALSWGIISLPLSLFRCLRQRTRRYAAFALRPAPTRPFLQWAGSLGLLSLLVILGWYNFKHPVQINEKIQAHWLSDKEVRVPLLEQNGGIFVMASLNGQQQLCKIDTGSDTIEWSRGLHIQGKTTGVYGQSCDLLAECVGIQTIVLPHLNIGGYGVTNLPTDMSEVGSGSFSPPPGPGNEFPLLGNPAFVLTVLTVDYKNAVMIIRSPQYDFTQQRRRAGDRVLQMGWTIHSSDKDWESSLYGTPAVRATIDGTSFWCTLDTGAGGPEICLTQRLVNQHPGFKQFQHDLAPLNATNSSRQVERLHNLNVYFPCLAPSHVKPISLKVDGLITPTLESDDPVGMGVIGRSLMQRYRITIDYQRRRVLLEPYAKDEELRKQENRHYIQKWPHI